MACVISTPDPSPPPGADTPATGARDSAAADRELGGSVETTRTETPGVSKRRPRAATSTAGSRTRGSVLEPVASTALIVAGTRLRRGEDLAARSVSAVALAGLRAPVLPAWDRFQLGIREQLVTPVESIVN